MECGRLLDVVVFNPSRPPEYKISNKQNPAAGLTKPCSATVLTVSDH